MRSSLGIRSALYGTMLVVGLMVSLMAALLLRDAWLDHARAAEIRRTDRVSGYLATAIPHLGYERGRVSSLLNRSNPIESADRDYVSEKRRDSDAALFAAKTELHRHFPALDEDLDGLMIDLARLRQKVDVELAKPASERNGNVVAIWVPTITRHIEDLQDIIARLPEAGHSVDFYFRYLNQLRLSLLRVRGMTGNESALYSVAVAQGNGAHPEVIKPAEALRARGEVLWKDLRGQSRALKSEPLENGLTAIEEKLFTGLHGIQDSISDAWRNGKSSPVDSKEYVAASLDALGAFVAPIGAISNIAKQYADEISAQATRKAQICLAALALVLLAAIWVVSRLKRTIIQPLEQLTRIADDVAAGIKPPSVPAQGVAEVLALARKLDEMLMVQSISMDEIRLLSGSLEKKVEERTRELEISKKDAEMFSYSVAHDLRAPLRAISGFATLIAENPDGKSARDLDWLVKIREAAQRMGNLIDALLSLAQLSQKQMIVTTVNLSAIADRIVDELRRGAPERVVTVDVEPDLVVRGDPDLLALVMQNLLENAWKYTATRANAHIRVWKRKADTGEIAVSDNGVGFDMAYASRLFLPFIRLHETQGYDGVGIGLANVKRIIDRHHGYIVAESVIGEGTTIGFALP
jgi:signal transduction histidine kinase